MKERRMIFKDARTIFIIRNTRLRVIVNDRARHWPTIPRVDLQAISWSLPEPETKFKLMQNGQEGFIVYELRNALQKIKSSKSSLLKQGIPINNGKKISNIEGSSFILNSIELYFLILLKITTPANLRW